jgi:hypothetical protein
MDHWWTHHPDWDIEFENDDMFCFARKEDTSRFRLYQRVYQVQHQQQNYCTAAKEEEEEVLTFYMWSSGWGSDFLNIADGLTLAVATESTVPSGLSTRRPSDWMAHGSSKRW